MIKTCFSSEFLNFLNNIFLNQWNEIKNGFFFIKCDFDVLITIDSFTFRCQSSSISVKFDTTTTTWHNTAYLVVVIRPVGNFFRSPLDLKYWVSSSTIRWNFSKPSRPPRSTGIEFHSSGIPAFDPILISRAAIYRRSFRPEQSAFVWFY